MIVSEQYVNNMFFIRNIQKYLKQIFYTKYSFWQKESLLTIFIIKIINITEKNIHVIILSVNYA